MIMTAISDRNGAPFMPTKLPSLHGGGGMAQPHPDTAQSAEAAANLSSTSLGAELEISDTRLHGRNQGI
jgi:hypothetical protein